MNTIMRLFRSRYLAAIIGGLLLAAAFPGIGVVGFGWIAPGFMLFAAVGTNRRKTFRIGYVAGLGFYLLSLHWLLLIPVPWTWAWAKALGWFALGAYLALYPAVWVWLGWKLYPVRWPKNPGAEKLPAQPHDAAPTLATAAPGSLD